MQAQPLAPEAIARIDALKPQKQAETLLEMAVGNSRDAVDQIAARADGWQGKLTWNPRLADLTTAARTASDLRVRQAGIAVELAAYGLARNSATVERLAREAASEMHARKIWALWSLGLMANRGVESERVVEVLRAHLSDADEDSRRWAVEGLALIGASSTIAPLLQAMHNDSSPLVRERAAFSLAASGMLSREQQQTAIPQLLSYSDDPALDAQTRGWVFRILGDITQQRLPNDSAAWRDWYATTQRD